MAASADDQLHNYDEKNNENSKTCLKICIIGDKLKEDYEVRTAAEVFGVPVIYSKTGEEFMDEIFKFSVVFVVEEFEGDIFENLSKVGHCIFGPTAIIQLAEMGKPLSINSRPLYAITMQGLVICLTGFRKRDDLNRMITLIHHMGGSVRKDFSISKTTHLVAHSVGGEKYNYASSFGIPIMQQDWVYESWMQRHNKNCLATDELLMRLKLPPFSGCKISFFGFEDDEKDHMEELTLQNGGKVVNVSDRTSTHLVIGDRQEFSSELEPEVKDNHYVVKAEWFWASIQMNASADETMHAFELGESRTQPQMIEDRKSKSRSAKRKRLESPLKLPLPGAGGSSLSPNSKGALEKKSMSPRLQVCTELFQTETNYVDILQTIMTVFKEPLEQPDQVGGPLLVAAEVKMIFGNLPPIYNVHKKLHKDLTNLVTNWTEENCIGSCFLNHSQDLLKAYPPFVNFFEKTREVLINCDMNKPRFHAFLKRCQSSPGCGRQSLVELLIRPVQRLPSVILLLNDILKKTSKKNPDYVLLNKAISCLKEIMMQINEDKRKTEGQVAMFDIVNDIENCPPNILSSNRSLVVQAEVQELNDGFIHKSDAIMMFLFTDMLEICKKKSRNTNVSKSPGVSTLPTRSQLKPFKHLELIHLSHIKRVIDVKEMEGIKNAFALVVRTDEETKEHLHTFILLSEEIVKDTFLRTLCQYIAATICRVGGDSLLTSMELKHLLSDNPDGPTSPLSKAIKIASKTCDKLSRVLSIKKIPLKPSSNINDSPVNPSHSASKLIDESK